MANYLVIDQGGSNSRVIVSDQYGSILAQNAHPVATIRNSDDVSIVEQDPAAVIDSIVVAMTKCVEQLSRPQFLAIQSAAIVCQRSSFVVCHQTSKQPLTNIISWQDTRAKKLLDSLNIDKVQLRELTGLQASAHFGASKMLWCQQQLAGQFEPSELIFAPLASFLIQRLTNGSEFFVDPANASRTLLLDVNKMAWHQDLLHLFSINKSCLPKIKPTRYHFGDIVIQDTKLPLKYVNGDQSAAFFARGEVLDSDVLANVGTGAFVSCKTPKPNTDNKAMLRSIVHYDKNQATYVLEGTINGAGSALTHYAKLFSLNEPWLSQTDVPKGKIPLFINTFSGLAAPYWRNDIASHFIGDSSSLCKWWAVLESIVFLLAVNIEQLKLVNNQLNRVYLSGGLSEHAVFCQMVADVTGLPLIKSEQAEASAFGALWWLAGCPKKWLSVAADKHFKNQNNQELLMRYQQWQKYMPIIQ